MKNKLKYLRCRNLKTELASYGYELTVKKALAWYGFATIAIVCVGLLYKLKLLCFISILLGILLLLPTVLILTVREKYNNFMFTLANNYIEQFLYTFKRSGTILQTLMEIQEIFDIPVFQEVLAKAIEQIQNDTESTDNEREGLDIIGKFFKCDKVNTIHSFVLGAQRRGGDYSGSISLLEQNRNMWVNRIYSLQREFKVIKRDIMFSVIGCLGISLAPIYMSMMIGESYDISHMLVCQISSAALILISSIVYVKGSKKLCKSWVETAVDKTQMGKQYEAVEAFDNKKEFKTSIKMAIIPFLLSVGLVIWKQELWTVVLGVLVMLFFLNQHKIGHRLLKRGVEKEITKQFPEWLMQIALLLQTNNVQMSIRLSLEDAPEVLKPAIEKLVLDLEKEPDEFEAYKGFLSSYYMPDVRSAMQNLYALSVGNITDIEELIQELISRNNAMLNKAEQLHQEDVVAGMRIYTLVPTLLVSFKLIIDMSLLMLLFMQW